MNIAVIGATGLVGQTTCKILEERKFPVDEFIPVASDKSKERGILFNKNKYQVTGITEALDLQPNLAFFTAGNGISTEWAPKFIDKGITVIDNSSTWRLDPKIKLVVPEINAHELSENDKLIANPNCSTIQLALALAPLHKMYKIKRLVISTYQSVTGTGLKAVEQLDNERTGVIVEQVYPHPIDLNCLPHAGDFEENHYTSEEIKLVNETRKILGDDSINITATAVRIPVIGGHSESVNVEFEKEYEVDEIRELMEASSGVEVQDDPGQNVYPMPIFAKGKDGVYVGRIRRDESQPNSLNMWIVSDNLRKGAATNAIQIGEHLHKKGWI